MTAVMSTASTTTPATEPTTVPTMMGVDFLLWGGASASSLGVGVAAVFENVVGLGAEGATRKLN